MSMRHIPSLTSIVDQIVVRREAIAPAGDPAEVAALDQALEAIVAYAQREDRLHMLAIALEARIKGEGAA